MLKATEYLLHNNILIRSILFIPQSGLVLLSFWGGGGGSVVGCVVTICICNHNEIKVKSTTLKE